MVIITFQSGADWYKANWIFRQFAKDVSKRFPTEAELTYLLEQAEAFGGLSLDTLEKDKASRMLKVIKEVAADITEGKIIGWLGTKPEDKDGQAMYLRSIAELLALAKEETDGA
jgi:hypothetical protein